MLCRRRCSHSSSVSTGITTRRIVGGRRGCMASQKDDMTVMIRCGWPALWLFDIPVFHIGSKDSQPLYWAKVPFFYSFFFRSRARAHARTHTRSHARTLARSTGSRSGSCYGHSVNITPAHSAPHKVRPMHARAHARAHMHACAHTRTHRCTRAHTHTHLSAPR